MDRYFPVVRRTGSQARNQGKACGEGNSTEETLAEVSQSASFHPHVKSLANKTLLDTLSDEQNPITHSDLADRSDRIISTSTGRQVAEDVQSRKRYFAERQEALRVQRRSTKESAPATGIFRNACIYINGYLEGTTDIEIKRMVIEGGGKVLFTPSARCTHIITSNGLSGSKTQKHLKGVKNKPFIVAPAWVLDSVESGRRRSERDYAVRLDQTLRGVGIEK